MRRWLTTLLGILLLAGSASAQIEVDDKTLALYLTEDGKLTNALELRDEQQTYSPTNEVGSPVQISIFYGNVWRIETNGEWTITTIFRNKPILVGKGKLDEKQLRKLAESLAVYDALSLTSIGRPLVNPHVISILFGPARAQMVVGVDQKLPKVNATNLPPAQKSPPTFVPPPSTDPKKEKFIPPALDPAARFGGIQSAVKGLIQPNLGVELNLPKRLKQLGQP